LFLLLGFSFGRGDCITNLHADGDGEGLRVRGGWDWWLRMIGPSEEYFQSCTGGKGLGGKGKKGKGKKELEEKNVVKFWRKRP